MNIMATGIQVKLLLHALGVGEAEAIVEFLKHKPYITGLEHNPYNEELCETVIVELPLEHTPLLLKELLTEGFVVYAVQYTLMKAN